jgi:hypothetical protein
MPSANPIEVPPAPPATTETAPVVVLMARTRPLFLSATKTSALVTSTMTAVGLLSLAFVPTPFTYPEA